MTAPTQPPPRRTEPTILGSNSCGWCDREIYLPALPCSTEPVKGLLRVSTRLGQGDRCKYELSTRASGVISEPIGL